MQSRRPGLGTLEPQVDADAGLGLTLTENQAHHRIAVWSARGASTASAARSDRARRGSATHQHRSLLEHSSSPSTASLSAGSPNRAQLA